MVCFVSVQLFCVLSPSPPVPVLLSRPQPGGESEVNPHASARQQTATSSIQVAEPQRTRNECGVTVSA